MEDLNFWTPATVKNKRGKAPGTQKYTRFCIHTGSEYKERREKYREIMSKIKNLEPRNPVNLGHLLLHVFLENLNTNALNIFTARNINSLQY